MYFIRKVSIAYYELYAKTVLLRTPANLSPSLKTSGPISHITSVSEVSIHMVSSFFGIQRTQEEKASKILNFIFPFYCPLECVITFSWSLSTPLKCSGSCTREYYSYSARRVRKTSASLPLLSIPDTWHMGTWNFLKCFCFCPCYKPVQTQKWCEK